MFKSILILILLSLCVGTAAWLVFIWSVKKGEYDDIERAKYRMLEDDDGLGPPGKDNSKQSDGPNQ
jgi:cbb3-type cytochrome oxidase maturation protein